MRGRRRMIGARHCIDWLPGTSQGELSKVWVQTNDERRMKHTEVYHYISGYIWTYIHRYIYTYICICIRSKETLNNLSSSSSDFAFIFPVKQTVKFCNVHYICTSVYPRLNEGEWTGVCSIWNFGLRGFSIVARSVWWWTLPHRPLDSICPWRIIGRTALFPRSRLLPLTITKANWEIEFDKQARFTWSALIPLCHKTLKDTVKDWTSRTNFRSFYKQRQAFHSYQNSLVVHILHRT